MQNNGESVLPQQPLAKDETLLDHYNLIKEENEKLLLENETLKKNLQKEKFYHQNLYIQWNELNTSVIDKNRELENLKSIQNPTLKIYQYAFYGLLLFTALLIVLNFYSNKNPGNPQISIPEKKDTFLQKVSSSIPDKGLANIPRDTVQHKKNPIKNTEQVNENQLPTQPVTILVTQSAVKYLIKQKSYFHNKPDNATQRSTFVLPAEDAYGILTALDDKNGFIYVVFINHAGRTSKGWIHKSDLKLLK